jgi:acetyltransferase-like isoleucine patch superfamily enzyme
MLTQKSRLPVLDILLYGFLPSIIKVLVYRLKGYRIGKGVSIGLGSIVQGKKVCIGDHTSIGFLTIIRGNRIEIGSHVTIGSTTFLDTANIEIGEDTRINEQVFVGGLQFPNSTFTVGRNCLIQQMSFINPSPSITIGNETAIGGHSLIFGHVSWQNFFEGYPVEFKPIEIGNHVGIGWRVFILPGSIIGDGAMIGANSVVNRKIPPKCLAVGFPARIVSKEPNFPKNLTDAEKADMLEMIINKMVEYLTAANIEIRHTGSNAYDVSYNKRKWFWKRTEHQLIKVYFSPIDEGIIPGINSNDTVVSLKSISKSIRSKMDSIHAIWIDIESKERSHFESPLSEEVIQFFKRYGLRLNRI